MKKILLILLLFWCAASPSYGQNKNVKVLLEQIGALQVYIGYAQKGYSIAKKGLDVIGDFKKGEFDLHTDYFNSLATVNPAVSGYARVGEILLLQGRVLQRCNETATYMQGQDYFHGDELDYLERVFARLLDDCDTILEELEAVTTDSQLTMKDSERLERLDKLYGRMMDAYTFCEQFTGDAKVLVQSRMREDIDVETARKLQGL